jgi:hypothetical protein
MMDGLGGFDFLDSNAGDGANTGALVTANAVFGKKMQAIVAIFGEGGFFMGVGKGYTACRGLRKVVNSSGTSANSLEEVLKGELEAGPEATHRSKKQNYLVMAPTAASAAQRAPSI